jgi:hypothetical protein
MSIDTNTLVAGVKKYPILFGCSIFVVILVGILYFRLEVLGMQQVELEKYSNEGKRYRSNIVNSAQLQEQLDFLTKANQAVRERTLTANGLALNLQYFYRLESEIGVKYIDLRPAGSPRVIKNAAYVPISYIVNVQGAFPQIIAFLKQLEQGAYFCRITSASASGSGNTVTVNLTLDLLGVP